MARVAWTCPECGCICGHFNGCPETPDTENEEPTIEYTMSNPTNEANAYAETMTEGMFIGFPDLKMQVRRQLHDAYLAGYGSGLAVARDERRMTEIITRYATMKATLQKISESVHTEEGKMAFMALHSMYGGEK